MTGFALDKKGDVIIENSDIKMVSDKDLTVQTVRQVLSTNLGEWWLNESEGIDFTSLLVKNPNFEQIEDIVDLALKQVDETFNLTEFNCSVKDRKIIIEFTAVNENGEKIEITDFEVE